MFCTARTFCLAGTEVVAGEGEAVVFATGGRTEFGRLAHLAQTAGDGRSPFLEEIARVSRIIAVIATSLGLSFFLIGLRAGLDLFAASIFAIGIIVANVPEGLLPTRKPVARPRRPTHGAAAGPGPPPSGRRDPWGGHGHLHATRPAP